MRTYFGPGEPPAITAGSHIGVHVIHAEHGVAVLPDRDILLQSMYSRAGVDLVINSPESGKFIVKGFFLSDQLCDLKYTRSEFSANQHHTQRQ